MALVLGSSRADADCKNLRAPFQIPAYLGPEYSGAFELHLSFKIESTEELARFKQFALSAGLKAVLIELPHGDFTRQPQTSSYLHGEIKDVHREASRLARLFYDAGFELQRVKLEAVVMSSKGIPRQNDAVAEHPAENYFESHFKVIVAIESDLSELNALMKAYDAHLSANAFKQLDHGRVEKFVTLRRYGLGAEETERDVQRLRAELLARGYQLSSTIREYSVFDSNIDLDRGWAH